MLRKLLDIGKLSVNFLYGNLIFKLLFGLFWLTYYIMSNNNKTKLMTRTMAYWEKNKQKYILYF